MSKYFIFECCDERIVCECIEELIEVVKICGDSVEEYGAVLKVQEFSDEEIANMGDVF